MIRFGLANYRRVASSALSAYQKSFLLLFWAFNLHFVPVQVSCQTLTSTLHSTEYGLKFAYDGEIVIFTCAVEGNTIAWSSDEYIGSDGNRLEFISIDQKGTEYNVGQTVATLLNVSSMNGLTMLESQLQISVQSVFQISSIRCHDIGSDSMNSISFGTNGNASITCDKLSACPGETVRCTCITGHSNTIAWSSDLLIGPNDARLEFISIDPVHTPIQAKGSNTSAVLTEVSFLNGVVVLFSDIIFIISDPANILTCLNVGQQKSNSIIVPMSKTCVPVSTTSIPTSSTNDLATSAESTDFLISSSGDVAIIGISVLLSTMIVILVILMVISVIVFYTRKTKKRVSDSEQHLQNEEVVNCDKQSKPSTSQTEKLRCEPDSALEGEISTSEKQALKLTELKEKDRELRRKEDELEQQKEEFQNERKKIEQLKEKIQNEMNKIEQLKEKLQNKENEMIMMGLSNPSKLQRSNSEGGATGLLHATKGWKKFSEYATRAIIVLQSPEIHLCQPKKKCWTVIVQYCTSDVMAWVQAAEQQKGIFLEKKGNWFFGSLQDTVQHIAQNEKLTKVQKPETKMFPVQVREEHEGSVEANVAGNRDRLHMAPAGNLKRPSVPLSGSGHFTKV